MPEQFARQVVAVDPGGVTGIAVWREFRQGPAPLSGLADPPSGTMDCIEKVGRPSVYKLLEHLLKDPHTEVVCESYRITQATATKSQQYDALYIIGFLDGLCELRGVPFKLQTPGEGKSFSTDGKLRSLDWYTPTPGGHANDACRHLLRYLLTSPKTDAVQQLLKSVVSFTEKV